MKKLNITKKHYMESRYFQRKYGKLEYVSESGKLFKTDKGKVLKFVKESNDYDVENDPTWKAMTKPIGELYKMLALDANEHDPEGEAFKKVGKKIQEALTEYFNETRGQSFPLNESKLFGKKFNESSYESLQEFYDWLKRNTELDSGITVKYNDNEDGSETLKMVFDDRYQWADDVVDGIKSKDEDEGIMEWLRVFQRKTTKNHWSLDIDEDDATDEYIITVKKPASKEDMYAETSDEGRWSEYGEFLGQLPMECIMDCSHSGKCDSEVEYWTDQLAFTDGLPLDKAIEFIAEYGAWDREELSQKSPEEIAQIVLWIFCGNLKDEAYQFMRDGDSEDWPDLEDWDEKDWRRFQEEQCFLGLNN